MAPLATLGVLLVVAAVFAVAVALGFRILDGGGFQAESELEAALLAAGLGFLVLEVAAFALASCAWLHRAQAVAILAGMALAAGTAWPVFLRRLAEAWRSQAALCATWKGKLAGAGLGLGAALAGLAAMAPLTGSDALRYHFTTALAAAGSRSPVRFDILHSFFTGESHGLIALGLALGSDRIALGLICTGGLITVAAVFLLARRMMPPSWAWACAITFLLTPIVFWQVGVSGAPDIWMAFFTVLAVLALERAVEKDQARWFVLAGLFAGAAGGAKYTGWFIAAAVVLICGMETRSLKRMVLCGACAWLAGFLPLLRNFRIGGDPFFPFLIEKFNSHVLPAFTFAFLHQHTRSLQFSLNLRSLLEFPIRVTLDGSVYGFGQWFGPIVLAFGPLLALVPWRKPLVRITGLVWLIFLGATAFTTQMGRFLLPVYPLALVLTVAGAFEAGRRGWRWVRGACVATLAFFLLFSAGADFVYARSFLPVAVGLQSRQAFLEKMAPDYPESEFINRELQGRPGKVMVFFLHFYYLRVPFVSGNPGVSRATGGVVDQGPEKLLAVLRRLKVRWVVVDTDFPAGLAGATQALEAENILRPVASSDVTHFIGYRIYHRREKSRVIIFRVETQGGAGTQ